MEGFVKVFSCICPFVGEEIWEKLGHTSSIAYEQWPSFDESKLVLNKINIAVAINGKTRDVIEIDPDAPQDDIVALAKSMSKVCTQLEGKEIRKVIYVKGRMLNFVI